MGVAVGEDLGLSPLVASQVVTPSAFLLVAVFDGPDGVSWIVSLCTPEAESVTGIVTVGSVIQPLGCAIGPVAVPKFGAVVSSLTVQVPVT